MLNSAGKNRVCGENFQRKEDLSSLSKACTLFKYISFYIKKKNIQSTSAKSFAAWFEAV